MLLLYSAFVLKNAVRNPLYILNPPVTPLESVELPRFSVLHYLDTTSSAHFPTRDLQYFKSIPKNKKIPVHTVLDLDVKEDVSVLENKYAQAEVRKWIKENIKLFRSADLYEVPNKDTNLISVFNYNLLKDLYRYKTSPLSRHNQFFNLYKTQWNHVKKALEADIESYHFVSMTLPNSIPSANVIEVILKFNALKMSRVITDENMRKLLDLYRWFNIKTRDSSTMNEITDEDAKRVVIEFQYKGYSTFLPLWVIQSLNEQSQLESAVKYSDTKVRKLFILMLLRIQDKVNTLLEGAEVVDDTVLQDTTPEEQYQKELQEEQTDEEAEDNSVVELKSSDFTEPFYKKQTIKDVNELSKLADNIPSESFDKLIDRNLAKFEEDTKEVDRIYEESVLAVKEESHLQESETQVFVSRYTQADTERLLQPKTLDTTFDKHIEQAVQFKTLTSTEIRSLKKLKDNRTLLKSPYDNNVKLDEFKIVTAKDTEITEQEKTIVTDNPLVSEDLKQEIINVFDKKYIKNVLNKDVIASVSNLERSGVIIKDYQIEENRSSLGNYEVHKLTLKPIDGKESTVYFRLPIIDSEGTFIASGIKYKQRKTRTNLVIFKVSPTRVALTTNYGKLFVSRTERKASDPYAYVNDYIRKSYIDEEGVIKKIVPGLKTLNKHNFPNIYQSLASQFNEVTTSSITFILNPRDVVNHIDQNVIAELSSKKLQFCGYLNDNSILVVDYDNVFHDYTHGKPIGTIADILNIEVEKLPKPFSVMKVLGDDIPLGVCLSYYLGLDGLLAVTGCEYEIVEKNARHPYSKDEVQLRFNDAKLIIKTPKEFQKLLFNGFLFYKDFIKTQNVNDFNLKDIYLNLIETRDSSLIHLKELNLLEELFLDPISIDVLRTMNEPDAFIPLLLRANDMLDDFSHPDVNDPHYARIRGYDRVPGLMYRALAESIREYKIKGRTSSKIELDPYKVWNYITQDSTVKITEDINPILNVKEAETVTFTGLDGLSKDATPAVVRRYHDNDIGLVSEGTVDSSDVALNIYLSPYAKIKNIRGLVDKETQAHADNPAKVFSTSALTAPMSEYDAPTRIN